MERKRSGICKQEKSLSIFVSTGNALSRVLPRTDRRPVKVKSEVNFNTIMLINHPITLNLPVKIYYCRNKVVGTSTKTGNISGSNYMIDH